MVNLMELIQEAQGGYRALEDSEKAILRLTVSKHEHWVRLWCRLLNLYFDGMTGIHDVDDPDENNRFARIVRLQFFALGLGHSKAAFDSVLTGFYNRAFFSIRYMAELFIHDSYVNTNPGEARRWYKHHSKSCTEVYLPTVWEEFKKAKAKVSNKNAFQSLYDTLKEMNALGAHPSQESLLQTINQLGDRVKVGAHYNQNLCITAMYKGQFMTLALLEEMSNEVIIDRAEWTTRVAAMWEEWRTTT